MSLDRDAANVDDGFSQIDYLRLLLSQTLLVEFTQITACKHGCIQSIPASNINTGHHFVHTNHLLMLETTQEKVEQVVTPQKRKIKLTEGIGSVGYSNGVAALMVKQER